MSMLRTAIVLTAFTLFLWPPSTSQADEAPCRRPPDYFSSERDYEAWRQECERSWRAEEKARDAAHERWKRDRERAREERKREDEQWRREEERAREHWKREQEQWKREEGR